MSTREDTPEFHPAITHISSRGKLSREMIEMINAIAEKAYYTKTNHNSNENIPGNHN
jgi:hypothetical protein